MLWIGVALCRAVAPPFGLCLFCCSALLWWIERKPGQNEVWKLKGVSCVWCPCVQDSNQIRSHCEWHHHWASTSWELPRKQAAHHHREVCATSQANGLDAEEGKPLKPGRAERVHKGRPHQDARKVVIRTEAGCRDRAGVLSRLQDHLKNLGKYLQESNTIYASLIRNEPSVFAKTLIIGLILDHFSKTENSKSNKLLPTNIISYYK